MSETFLSHFDEDFAVQLLAIICFQACMLILYLLHLQGSHLPLRSFWKHFRTVQLHVDPFPHVLLILVEVSGALCPSLNSCNIRNQISHFGIFIIEGFLYFKTIVILKINYKLLLSIHYLVNKLKFTQNVLLIWCKNNSFATQHFKRTFIL